MKRLFEIVLAAALLLSLAGCTQQGRRTGAMKFLNQDIVAITAAAQETLATGQAPDVHFDGVERISYARSTESEWVAFVTGSREDGDSVTGELVEVGFYYSPDNRPIKYNGWLPHGEELAQDPLTGEKYACSVDTDSLKESYYTEYLQPGWYYYEFESKYDFSDVTE